MRRVREHGASGVLFLVILLLVITALLAGYVLQRMTSGTDANNDTQARLARASNALVQYAAANRRLPCPANPALASGAANDGVESPPNGSQCDFADGTLPWNTLGLRSDDGYDAWGRRISYRVYTGNAGSLTQAGGLSMVECDTVDVGAATAVGAGNVGGLCVSSPDPYQRSTTPANFLNNKGLTIDDFGTNHTDAAFVLISHGATGLGGYTVSGDRLPMPAGTEKNNTKDTGPFTIKAFSDPDTGVSSGQHFDDLLAYKTLSDLVSAAGLGARDWPESVTTSTTFDNASVSAAAGHAVGSGDVGTATLNFGAASVSAFTGGSTTPADIAFDTVGTPSTGGIGVFGAASNFMSSDAGEYIVITFADKGSSFALTLNDFGTYSSGGNTYTENVQLTFKNAGVLVGSPVVESGCRNDGRLASFSVTPSGAFDSVEIRPVDATASGGLTNISSFMVSEVKACAASVSSCTTGLANGGNTCP